MLNKLPLPDDVLFCKRSGTMHGFESHFWHQWSAGAVVSGGFQTLPVPRRLHTSSAGLQESDVLLTAGQIPRAGRTDALGTTLCTAKK